MLGATSGIQFSFVHNSAYVVLFNSANAHRVITFKQTLEHFADYHISVVGRKLNKLAHELAFLARTAGNQAIAGSVPENLKDLFLAECNPTH